MPKPKFQMTNQAQNPNDKKRQFWHLSIWILFGIGILTFGFFCIRWLRKNSSLLFRGQARLPESRRNGGQRGFTLLETVLAVAIIGSIGIGVLKAVDTNARSGRVLDEKVQATNLATAYLENMRQLGYDDSTSPYPTISTGVTIPTQYSVAVNIAYSPDGNTWATTNNSGAYKLQKITLSVLREGGKLVLSTCTFRTKR